MQLLRSESKTCQIVHNVDPNEVAGNGVGDYVLNLPFQSLRQFAQICRHYKTKIKLKSRHEIKTKSNGDAKLE